jgi:hypothetical protein
MEIRIFQILISDRVSRASLEMAGGRKSDGDAPYYLKPHRAIEWVISNRF